MDTVQRKCSITICSCPCIADMICHGWWVYSLSLESIGRRVSGARGCGRGDWPPGGGLAASRRHVENFPRLPSPARTPPAMRRIPRSPLRALEPPRPLSSPCRPCGTSGSRTAAVATSATRHFIVPAGKQDKKKHQQFVRRWQKRLLGDSEPIGAHVDPYDPTSPVRIAPEEQGEYEEVLEEAADAGQPRRRRAAAARPPVYQPATDAHRLQRVGDQQWQQRRVEADLAREFEKLTLRTYTPLSLGMASEIEVLTGTPYTLRDENLLMAQMVHQATGRPYTHHNFGLMTKPTSSRDLRRRFEQAVVEIFARKQAGLDLDLAKLVNRGVYDAPRWVQDIKLCRTDSGELALAFPKYKSAEEFLQIMETAPSLEESVPDSDELLVDPAAAEEAEVEAEIEAEVVPPEQVPTMDPATPAFKRAAVVKTDTERKPFDFMSNRPVPRAKPVEQSAPVEKSEPIEQSEPVEVVETKVLVGNEEKAATSSVPESAPLEAASESTSPASTFPSSLDTTEDGLHRSVDDEANASANAYKEVKWRSIPLTDVALKFAVSVASRTTYLTLIASAFQTTPPAHIYPHFRSPAV